MPTIWGFHYSLGKLDAEFLHEVYAVFFAVFFIEKQNALDLFEI